MQLNIYGQTMLQSHQQKLRLSRFYLQPFHHFIAAKKPLQVIQHLSGINLGTKARLETRVWRLTKQKNVFSEQRHARASQAIKILIKITHTQCLPAAGSCRTRALADNERNLQHLFHSQGILITFMDTFITLVFLNRKIWRPSRLAYRQIDVTCCWPRTLSSCSGTHIWRSIHSSTFIRGK